jgi:hypothetical protein
MNLRIAPPFCHGPVGGNAMPARFAGYDYVPFIAINGIGFHTPRRRGEPLQQAALALAALGGLRRRLSEVVAETLRSRRPFAG